jgi:integrase
MVFGRRARLRSKEEKMELTEKDIEAPLTIPSNTSLIAPLPATYLQAATSDNTRKAYQHDIRHFINCGGLLPTSVEGLLQYLHAQATLLNPRTLSRRLVAIKHWHIYQGFPDPTTHPLVKKTLSGVLHIHGKPAEKAPPLSIEQLSLIISHLQSRGSLSDWRNSALLQTGFLGALRRSELVALQWEQITFVPEGIEILIARSKTDQIGEGQVCAIPYGNIILCPVTALQKWQEASQIKTGPIFRRLFKNDQISDKPLTPQSINLIIKSLALECHLPKAEQYSGHSLRRGFATAASQKGASLGAIMRQGRWKHEGTVQGYIEEGKRFDANAAGAILDNLET